jgi:hypothetical protein
MMPASTPPPHAVCEAGSFTCTNNGERKLQGLSAKPGATKIKLTVNGSPVVTVAAAASDGTYTSCTAQDSNGVNQPCSSTTVSASGPHKLTAGGKAVLLSSDSVASVNVPAPSGAGPAKVNAGQTKLTAS